MGKAFLNFIPKQKTTQKNIVQNINNILTTTKNQYRQNLKQLDKLNGEHTHWIFILLTFTYLVKQETNEYLNRKMCPRLEQAITKEIKGPINEQTFKYVINVCKDFMELSGNKALYQRNKYKNRIQMII